MEKWKGALLTILALALVVLVGSVIYRARQEMAALPSPSPAATEPPPEPTSSPEQDPFASYREYMVRSQIEARGVKDSHVLEAMRSIPRHEYVPREYQEHSYADRPLPIGYGQTISQPYIVALMTELLGVQEGDRVLEVGTGSGYQAAVLAEIVDEVYTVEIIPELAELAAKRLKRLGYTQVQAENLDGYYGWEEHAPYDAIIVTCAPDHVPSPLLKQLKDGGRLVIPVGPPGAYQTLWLIRREGEEFRYENWGGVAFVPLTGEH